MIISLVYSCVLIKCSRIKKKKDVSSGRSSSYIEEDTKLEEKYQRPAWDKQFPNILPPPVRVPEKENKEVDVEPDIMIMSAPRLDRSSALESDLHKDHDARKSEILDPVFDDRTQASVEIIEGAGTPREKMMKRESSELQSQGLEGNEEGRAKGSQAYLQAGKAVKDGQRRNKSKETYRKSKESIKKAITSKETQSDSKKNTKRRSKERSGEKKR